MKANEAPEKLYFGENDKGILDIYSTKESNDEVEYTCTDAFIEKALKWYCLDCSCNDNCKYKCAFWSFFKDYLKGNDKALPPKIENAFNPDGSTTENYRYRHFIKRMQDAFIEKAAEFLYNYNQKQVLKHGARATLGCGEYTINVDEFRNYMKGK